MENPRDKIKNLVFVRVFPMSSAIFSRAVHRGALRENLDVRRIDHGKGAGFFSDVPRTVTRKFHWKIHWTKSMSVYDGIIFLFCPR